MRRPPVNTSVNYKDNLKDGFLFGYLSLAFIRSFNGNSEIGLFARAALLNNLMPVISWPHHEGSWISSDLEFNSISAIFKEEFDP